MQTMGSEAEKAKIAKMISDAHTTVLMTVDAGGRLDARPMACIQREFDGVLWFMTSRNSHKLDEIARNPGVLVSYADPRAREFVVIQWRAHHRGRRDRADPLERSAEDMVPGRPSDPDLALISIEV